jgi:tetratricopeptide (TPR) repeat protein
MLLIVEDIWNKDDVRLFRFSGPYCAQLFTTRLSPETWGLMIAESIKVPELGREDAINLLSELAPRAIDKKSPEAKELVEAVAGLPLALILMGNYLRITGHAGQQRRIREAVITLRATEKRLNTVGETEDGTPISLQAAIDLSYNALSAEARHTLRALATFAPKPYTFSEEGALAVSEDSTQTLDSLVDSGLLEVPSSSLVRATSDTDSDRYTLHQTVVDYAQLATGEERLLFQQRLVNYLANFIQQNNNTSSYLLLEEEWQNIIRALRWARQNEDWESLNKAVIGLTAVRLGVVGFLDARGYWGQAEEFLAEVLESPQAEQDRFLEATTLFKHGVFRGRQGKIDEAVQQLSYSWVKLNALYNTPDVILCQAHLCGFMSQFMMEQNPEDAIRWAQRGITVSEKVEANFFEHELGYLYIRKGAILGRTRKHPEAIEVVQRGLTLLPEEPTPARVSGLTILGNIYAGQGRAQWAKALKYWSDAISDVDKLGDNRRLAGLWQNVAIVESWADHFMESIRGNEKALELYERIGDVIGECRVRANVADDYIKLGEDETALSHLATALEKAREHQLVSNEMYALVNLARLQIYCGKTDEAEAGLRRAYDICLHVEETDWASEILRLQSKIALQNHDLNQARTLIDQSFGQVHHRKEEGVCWRAKGELLFAVGDTSQAIAAYEQSLALLSGESEYELARTQLTLGQLYWECNLKEKARVLLEDSLSTFEGLGAKRDVGIIKPLLQSMSI